MEILLASSKSTVMNFEVSNKYFDIARVVAIYNFGDGTLSYDIYPIIGISKPKLFLVQPIIRSKMKMTYSKAILYIYQLEKSLTNFGYDPELGYNLKVDDNIYLWNLDNGIIRFIKVGDSEEQGTVLFDAYLEHATNKDMPAIFYTDKLEIRRYIQYRVVA